MRMESLTRERGGKGWSLTINYELRITNYELGIRKEKLQNEKSTITGCFKLGTVDLL
jgi:hypothetical protein